MIINPPQHDAWRQMNLRVDGFNSVIVFGPRYYGKRKILRHMAQQLLQNGIDTALLSPFMQQDGLFNYADLWESVVRGSKMRSRAIVSTASSFSQALASLIARRKSPLAIMVNGPGREAVQPYWEFVSLLNRILDQFRESPSRLVIVVSDDHSLLHYKSTSGPNSPWAYLDPPIRIGLMNVREVRDALTGLSDKVTEIMANSAAKITGGHPGLVMEIMSRLASNSIDLLDPPGADDVVGWLGESYILSRICQMLAEGGPSLAQLAIGFRTGAIPSADDPNIPILVEYGVLNRHRGMELNLCGGAIQVLVETLAAEKDGRDTPSTIIGDTGVLRVVHDAPDVSDDDLVILHISDLHASEEYGFRLPLATSITRLDLPRLEDLLFGDLQRMGLHSRVDGVIISGDLVTNGQRADEFQLARAVIEAILDKLDLKPDQLLVVPGNHDIGWDRSRIQEMGRNASVTRDTFQMFLELLKQPHQDFVVSRDFRSRSNHSLLRVVGLDSNFVESRTAAGIGYIVSDDLQAAGAILEKTPLEDRFAKWLVCHHHVFPNTSVSLNHSEKQHISTMANAPEIQSFAYRSQVEAILHGHEHQPGITLARRWPLDIGREFAPLISLGAGSVGVERTRLGPFGRNHYFVLIRRQNDIIIRSRQLGDNGISFVRHQDIRAAIPMLQSMEIVDDGNPKATSVSN